MEVAPERLIDEPFAFQHGIRAFNRYRVGRVYNPVQNGIGKRVFTDFAVPAARSELEQKMVEPV